MADDIFIGVDGGATKSRVRIENSAGHLLGQGVGGPANISLSVDTSWESIYHALEEALSLTTIRLDSADYHFHLGLGLAGCEVPHAVTDFLSRQHPFSTLHLVSDAHVACVGAHQGRDGAIIVVGTGVIGYEIESGKCTRIGGWGFPHDDEGGGAWLGLEAARLTFQWLDRRVEKSPLVEDVFGFFNHDIETFTTWANRANSTEFARLAPLVINHAQQEEVAALRLIKKAAHAVDRIGLALMKSQKEREKHLPCSLLGGMAPFIKPWLCDELRGCLVPRVADAAAGAILMIRERVTSGATQT
ncbi:MAG TPA: BadF/BadG/BcrA/BcrD ATPase family protein [Gammaproteobacteria bacterium]|nr:BadF/BadG/BcrA/BcrD ATPase family protein [Gammaproteobacteria bacterium]